MVILANIDEETSISMSTEPIGFKNDFTGDRAEKTERISLSILYSKGFCYRMMHNRVIVFFSFTEVQIRPLLYPSVFGHADKSY